MSSITQGTAQESAPGRETRGWLERLLSLELSVDAELAGYVALVAIAFALHFWDLGARALHHDESLHATYSYYLFHGSGYKHDPLMHGPVLFHLTALMYFLFGVGDAVARFSAAFAGTALVFMPFFLRRWLGRWGALSASAMLTFSPAILYFSRFIREDIFVSLWTVGLFIALWRYIQEGHARWLYLAAACLALGFANKELTFMIAAIVLSFTDVLLALELSAPSPQRPSEVTGRVTHALLAAALIPTAWIFAAFWYPLRDLRRRLGIRRLPRSGELLIVMGTLTLPQLAALVQVAAKRLHIDMAAPAGLFFGTPMTNEGLVGGATVALLLGVSVLVGLGWNWRRWAMSALVFYGIFVCLFTTFFTNPNGFVTGIWGGLDYWLAQQDVQRGGQPVFYYLMMIPFYAYIPLALAAIGLVYQCLRRGIASAALFAATVVVMPLIVVAYARSNVSAIPLVILALALLVAALRGDPLRQMLVTWVGGLLLGLSVAGEKMPWLTIHLEVPLILLAGASVRDVIVATSSHTKRLMLLAAACTAGVLVVVAAAWGPGSDGGRAVVIGVALLVAAIAALLAGLRLSPGMGVGVLAAALLGILAPLSLRTAFALSYQHGDTPNEALVYTQSSPEIPKIMADIEQYARQSGQGQSQPIVVDSADAFSWPWAWYLRDYRQTAFIDLSGYLTGGAGYHPPAHAILLLNDADQAIMQQFRGQFGAGIPYHHRWWFPEDYRGTTAPSLMASLPKGSTWARWWGLLVGAHGIVRPPAPESPGVHVIGSVDSTAYFPPDYVPGVGISINAERVPPPRTTASGALVLGGPGSANGAFLRPAGMAVDTTGNIYVADSQNNRIEKFNSAGRLVATTADSSAPGGFQEPWDVAVDRQGMLYVADTWNHRIVKLDPQLHFLTSWGYPTKPPAPDSLLSLYGPRDIAFEPSGNLLVTDTGNSRVIEFSPDGQPLRSFGSAGTGPGQFQEPVGIAVGPDGTIYVADTWNGRVEVFDSSTRFLRSLPVSGWQGRDIENKPYLALLPNGDLLLTQPDSNRLVELSPTGATVKSLSALGPDLPLSRPIGVATDGAGKVYISDGVSDQVIRQASSSLP